MKVSSGRISILSAAAALAFSNGLARGGTLTWDSGGASPTDPADGWGTWDTATPDWSNGTTDQTWINDGTENAVLGNYTGNGGVVTIATPINAASITFNPGGDNYVDLLMEPGGALNLHGDVSTYGPAGGISAIELDSGTLNMMGHNLAGTTPNELVLYNGTLLNLNSINDGGYLLFVLSGTVTLGGVNNFTSPINTSSSSVYLESGGSLGDTQIGVQSATQTKGRFTAAVGTFAGSSGTRPGRIARGAI